MTIHKHNQNRKRAMRRALGFTIGKNRWPYPLCRKMSRYFKPKGRHARSFGAADQVKALVTGRSWEDVKRDANEFAIRRTGRPVLP